ncbi:MAG TPA: response regulator [Myxococcota bacterium]
MPTTVLAEDDDATRRMMRVLLEHYGHVVIEAADGVEATLACAPVVVIDLVIVDLQMPRMGGRELVRRLGDREQSPRVLVCSGSGRIEGLPLLRKPFTPQQFRAAIDHALAAPTLAQLQLQLDGDVVEDVAGEASGPTPSHWGDPDGIEPHQRKPAPQR